MILLPDFVQRLKFFRPAESGDTRAQVGRTKESWAQGGTTTDRVMQKLLLTKSFNAEIASYVKSALRPNLGWGWSVVLLVLARWWCRGVCVKSPTFKNWRAAKPDFIYTTMRLCIKSSTFENWRAAKPDFTYTTIHV